MQFYQQYFKIAVALRKAIEMIRLVSDARSWFLVHDVYIMLALPRGGQGPGYKGLK
jgi:hypothetical protein